MQECRCDNFTQQGELVGWNKRLHNCHRCRTGKAGIDNRSRQRSIGHAAIRLDSLAGIRSRHATSVRCLLIHGEAGPKGRKQGSD